MDKLPQLKKNIKNFILGEDAKVIDKTATKIALTISYIAFSILDANAGGGSTPAHYKHTNHLAYPGNDPSMNNQLDTNYITTKADPGGSDRALNIDVPAKTVQSSHANHYNFIPRCGKKC